MQFLIFQRSMFGISWLLRRLVRHVLSWGIQFKFLIFRDQVRVGSRVYIDAASDLKGFNLVNDGARLIGSKLGFYSYVSPYTILVETDVGNYCSIGPGCKIGLGLHPIDDISTSPYIYNEQLFKKRRQEDFDKVVIGHDVWIGANALVMGGARIGNGAVIAAGAVVTKDVPSYAVVVGVPARVLKMRFSESKIKKLEDSSWWDMGPEKVREVEW